MSAPAIDPSRNLSKLKRRVDMFLRDPRLARSSVSHALAELAVFGEAAIIGGMLREMLIGEYYQFSSDVDVVVDARDLGAFDKAMEAWGARRNAFGGYALEHLPWKVDVWALGRTWAHVSGHHTVSNLNDVLHTTFFNWDAILYSVGEKRFLAAPTYLDQLRARYLDMNLEPNPNPTANLIRMLRAARRHNATISPRLVVFAFEGLGTGAGDEALLAEEQRIYRRRRAILTQSDLDTARAAFREGMCSGKDVVPFPREQMRLLEQGLSRSPSQVPAKRMRRQTAQVQERLSV